jgi:cytochrome c peroxidase
MNSVGFCDPAKPEISDDMTTSFNKALSLIFFVSTLLLANCGGSSGGGNDDSSSGASMRSVGKKLFFDEDLSSNGNQSCASCHDPAAGFADPSVTAAAPVSEGSVPGQFGNRNAPTTAYTSLTPEFAPQVTQTVDLTVSNFQGGQFLDGRASTLMEQAKAPFLNPVEMNNADKADVVSKVQNASYADDFIEVFGANAFNDVDQAYDNIAAAIAVFETSGEMNPFTSKFDAIMDGNASFTASEQRGFDLFKGPVAKCGNCHTVDTPAAGSLFTDFNYYNIAIPVNTDNPAYVANNSFRDGGLGDSPVLTVPAEQAAEQGKFRTPTLRNVELTAPYMHNGVYATLDDVIRHYDITATDSLLFVSEVENDIANELNYHTDIGLGMSMQDYTDLENFMLTLTDGYF